MFVENFVMKRLGSDPDWVSKYFGKCGQIPKIQEKSRSLQLNTKISELLRFDQAGKSQTVEWEAISKKKKEHKHIPQPKPIARLTPKYIPFLDDNNREWIPNWINIDNPGQEEHIKIGKYFTKGVQNLRGLDLPKQIYDSEYQLIGRTVLRAENNKRRGASQRELLKQKEHISKIFDELMGLDSGEYHGNINNKRSAPQYTGVPAYTQPDQTIKHQTSNMFSDNSNKKHLDTNKNTYTTKYRPRIQIYILDQLMVFIFLFNNYINILNTNYLAFIKPNLPLLIINTLYLSSHILKSKLYSFKVLLFF